MKRRMTLSLVLTLSVLLSLVSFPLTTQAQQTPRRFSASSGMVTLGMGQVLRVTVDPGDVSGNTWFRFAWAQYMAAGCSGMPQVCRHTVGSQGATAPVTVGDDGALSFDVPVSGAAVNVTVSSNRQNARVVFQIIKADTGEIVAILTDDLFNG